MAFTMPGLPGPSTWVGATGPGPDLSSAGDTLRACKAGGVTVLRALGGSAKGGENKDYIHSNLSHICQHLYPLVYSKQKATYTAICRTFAYTLDHLVHSKQRLHNSNVAYLPTPLLLSLFKLKLINHALLDSLSHLHSSFFNNLF